MSATVYSDQEAGRTIYWVVCSVHGPLEDHESFSAAHSQRREHLRHGEDTVRTTSS